MVATGARLRTVDTPGAKLRNVHYLGCWMIPRPVSADRIANSAGFKPFDQAEYPATILPLRITNLDSLIRPSDFVRRAVGSWSGNSIKPRTKAIVQMHHCLMA